MKSLYRVFLLSLVIGSALMAEPNDGRDSLGVLDRVRLHSLLDADVLQLAWQNPAVRQWQRDYSLSEVAAGYQLRHESQAVVAQLGDHASQFTFDAGTHLKHRSSTLWGAAHYDHGSTRHIAWNETSDPDMVYPYLLADSSASAPMRHERYAFGGGYADHNGRWHWGAEVGYEAGHYYRNVDPRPRNVTARLVAKGGAGLSLTGRYVAAAALSYVKYKQTNDVAFYSEMGKEKLFHLTGLVNDYGRFAGAADQTYYHGHQWQAVLGVQPTTRRGWSTTLSASRLTLDKVLTTLNKLPMARIIHTALEAEAAWLAEDWAVRGHVDAHRRVGRENVFGDPAAAVYPQIGALDMYHENRFAAGVDGIWQHSWHAVDLGVRPTIDYAHRNVVYADPPCRQYVNDLTTALSLRGGWRTAGTYTTLGLATAWTHPVDSELLLSDVKNELAGLQRVVESDYRYASHDRLAFAAELAVTAPIGSRLALQAKASWQYTAFTASVRTHMLSTAVALLF